MAYYKDEEGIVHTHIFLLEEDSAQHAQGFHFENETYSELYGPFTTLEICKAELKRYCVEYLGT
jgi:hypothetical protein